MPSLIATHEVDDVAHWLASPKREEVFASVASNSRTFVDPSRANHVGLRMDVADMAAFQALIESEAGAEAMKYDGVHPDMLAVYVASSPEHSHDPGRGTGIRRGRIGSELRPAMPVRTRPHAAE